MPKNTLLFILLVFNSHLAFASEALFGAEWTFSNSEIIKDSRSLGGRDSRNERTEKWLEYVRQSCSGCTIEYQRVTLPNGVWFEISSDPWVVELSTKPMTLEELRENRAALQELVWDAAKKAGLKPHWRVGGGHTHMDIKGHFGKDKMLFRNFVVDLMNRPYLFMGGFSYDYLNAPPLAILGKDAIAEMKEILKKFDKGRMSISDFMSRVSSDVYPKSKNYGTETIGSSKYQAVNLDHSQTIEIRGFRPQMSALHVQLIAEIFTGRIEALRGVKEPIPLKVKNYSNKVSTRVRSEMEKYKTDVPPEKILLETFEYIRAAGVDPARYADFITKELRSELERPVESYLKAPRTEMKNSGEWKKERVLRCRTILAA